MTALNARDAPALGVPRNVPTTMDALYRFAEERAWRSPADYRAMHSLLVAALKITGPLRVKAPGGGTYVIDEADATITYADRNPLARDARTVPAPDLDSLIW